MGHHSDCVRTYKRTSDEIRKDASSKISGGEIVENNDSVRDVKDKSGVDVEGTPESIDKCLMEEQKQRNVESLSACQMIKNVIRTRMELQKKRNVNVLRRNKLAKKLVMKEKNRKVRKHSDSNQKVIIDLNVNVNMKK